MNKGSRFHLPALYPMIKPFKLGAFSLGWGTFPNYPLLYYVLHFIYHSVYHRFSSEILMPFPYHQIIIIKFLCIYVVILDSLAFHTFVQVRAIHAFLHRIIAFFEHFDPFFFRYFSLAILYVLLFCISSGSLILVEFSRLWPVVSSRFVWVARAVRLS